MVLEYHRNKLIPYIVLLIICSLIFLTTLNFLNGSRTWSIDAVDTTTIADKIAPEQTNTKISKSATISSKKNKGGEPKSYPAPPQDVLDKIMSNVVAYDKIALSAGSKTAVQKTRKIAHQNILLTTIVNSGMIDYTLNWIETLKRTNQDQKFLVFAIDEGVVNKLTEYGYGDQVSYIPDEWLHVALDSKFSLWKTNNYKPITHAKSLIVERLLHLDITVWFTDVDIVFLSPHIRDTMLFQMVERPNTDIVFSQEVDQRTINSGFYMMKPSKLTKLFMHKVVTEQDKAESLTQQKVMNKVLKDMFPRDLARSPYRLLDMLLFPNGNYYFRQDLPTRLGIEPMIIHANYLVGENKKKALINAGHWYYTENKAIAV